MKGVKNLNPLTILYLIIMLAVISAVFDYKVTLITVTAMILIAAAAGEGKEFISLWLKSIFLICLIYLTVTFYSWGAGYLENMDIFSKS